MSTIKNLNAEFCLYMIFFFFYFSQKPIETLQSFWVVGNHDWTMDFFLSFQKFYNIAYLFMRPWMR